MSFLTKLGRFAESAANAVAKSIEKHVEMERQKAARLDRMDEDQLNRRLDHMLVNTDGRGSRDAADVVRALERRGYTPRDTLRAAFIRTGTRPPTQNGNEE